MIELRRNALVFLFPEVHPKAQLTLTFQRTFRIPDDEGHYPLPPGFGSFPLEHVDDYPSNSPSEWIEHGGVMLPMYQSEAMWIDFDADYLIEHRTQYPFAVKIATGKTNALTGHPWSEGLRQDPQDYLVVPEQPWLDGYCVEKGMIRQFVAMPLGEGYTAEEQLTGKAKYRGLQVAVYPMKRKVFERRFPMRIAEPDFRHKIQYSVAAPTDMVMEMGLAPGGRMRQEIYEDPFDLNDWEIEHRSRCFVHIANSLVWRAITGKNPPTVPLTARKYSRAGLPWFEYYDEGAKKIKGSKILAGMKGIVTKAKEKVGAPLPENETVIPDHIVKLRSGLKKDQVREGAI